MIAYPPRKANRAATPKSKTSTLPALLSGILLLGALGASAQTSSLTLAWDPSSSLGIAGYRLYEGGASHSYTNTLNVGNVTTATVSGLTAGATYFFAVTAISTNGMESAFSSEISYTVPLPPPAIVLTAPANGAVYIAPANVALAASVVPNGHTITKVQFFSGSTLLAEDTATPYAFAWNNVGAGSYSLSAKAVYDAGSTVASAPVTVTVAAVTNSPPATNPPPASSLTFASDSGVITAPFVAANGVVSQSVTTGVSTGGRAVYTFTITTAGDYVIAANVNAPNTGANSFYVNIDAEPTDPLMIWDIPVTSGFAMRRVSWRGNGTSDWDQFSPRLFNLSQGTHQLIVRGREANTQLGAITITPYVVLPAPWQVVDIGNVGATGFASSTNGLFTILGAGNLSGLADNFRFLYQSLSGDGEIRAQLTSMQNTSTNARAGVLIRETLTSGSKYAFMGISPDGNFRWQSRTSTAGSTGSSSSGYGTLPNIWTRLVRSGNTLYGYKSTDGVTWTLVNSNTNVMASNIYIGLAVAAGTTNALNASIFSNVTVVP